MEALEAASVECAMTVAQLEAAEDLSCVERRLYGGWAAEANKARVRVAFCSITLPPRPSHKPCAWQQSHLSLQWLGSGMHGAVVASGPGCNSSRPRASTMRRFTFRFLWKEC